VPSEFVQAVIKSEPVDFEEADEEMEREPEPRGIPPLMWRCPLVTCPETFNSEVEMHQHLNLSHAVKGKYIQVNISHNVRGLKQH
jgi:hypothetical protein